MKKISAGGPADRRRIIFQCFKESLKEEYRLKILQTRITPQTFEVTIELRPYKDLTAVETKTFIYNTAKQSTSIYKFGEKKRISLFECCVNKGMACRYETISTAVKVDEVKKFH